MANFEAIDKKITELREEIGSYAEEAPQIRAYAIGRLEGLVQRLEGPRATYEKQTFFAIKNICLLMAGEMGLLDAVVDNKEGPIDARQLALRLGYQESLITRIMRLLTAHGVCDEAGQKRYSANATTELLSMAEMKGATIELVELVFPIAGKIKAYVEETKLGANSDHSSLASPFTFTYGSSLFEFLMTNSRHKEAFDYFMAGKKKDARQAWYDKYPVADACGRDPRLRQLGAVVVVDVGGGKGHDLLDFRQNFPEVPGRVILQDLPKTFENYANPDEDIELVPLDFFQEEPVAGAKFYYMRNILHDWPDDSCRKILSKVRGAMIGGYSKLLIEDLVLPDTGAHWTEASSDMLMMLMMGGVERTQHEWESLLTSTNMKVSKIWRGSSTQEPIIEVELA